METQGTNLGGVMAVVGIATFVVIVFWFARAYFLSGASLWQGFLGLALWLVQFMVLVGSILACVGGGCEASGEQPIEAIILCGNIGIAVFLVFSWNSTTPKPPK